MPSQEYNQTGVVPVPSTVDPALFCRERCRLLKNQYFALLQNYTKCQCVPNVPLGGEKKNQIIFIDPECTSCVVAPILSYFNDLREPSDPLQQWYNEIKGIMGGRSDLDWQNV